MWLWANPNPISPGMRGLSVQRMSGLDSTVSLGSGMVMLFPIYQSLVATYIKTDIKILEAAYL